MMVYNPATLQLLQNKKNRMKDDKNSTQREFVMLSKMCRILLSLQLSVPYYPSSIYYFLFGLGLHT